MELEKFDRQLRLMVLLTQNRELSVEDISTRLNMSRRSIYRYIDAFRQMGFIVRKRGTRYNIDHSSPFFQTITERIHFSQDEAITIANVLNAVIDNSPEVRHLREKLSTVYDLDILRHHGIDDRLARNLSATFRAIEGARIVVLHDYNSPHSHDVRDRIVEPYIFLAENSEVRCYELSTGENKTFKLTRCASVELLDLLWSNKDKHVQCYQDLFHFTSEHRLPVKLRLGALATSILLEEYPAAESFLTPEDTAQSENCGEEENEDKKLLGKSETHIFATDVCSYIGIGRFVLGLYDDIEIIDSPDFQQYINTRIEDLTKKIRK